MSWFIYILRCSNGSFYIGHARDVERRLTRHAAGTGAQHTAVYCPERILYRERFDTEAEAARRERQIKKWGRAKKKALIEGDFYRLRELAKSRG